MLPGSLMSMRVAKPLVFVACLAPFLLLIANGLGVGGSLGANPIDKITDVTGTWTLRFVLITLAVTPLRRLTGWNAVIRMRRMLGLFAFFYGSLHFLTWAVLDQGLAWRYIGADIAKRPVHHRWHAGTVVDGAARDHVDGGLDSSSGRQTLADAAPVDLRHRGVRRGALPVAGEVGSHASVDLRCDPLRPSRDSRVVCLAAEAGRRGR